MPSETLEKDRARLMECLVDTILLDEQDERIYLLACAIEIMIDNKISTIVAAQ